MANLDPIWSVLDAVQVPSDARAAADACSYAIDNAILTARQRGLSSSPMFAQAQKDLVNYQAQLTARTAPFVSDDDSIDVTSGPEWSSLKGLILTIYQYIADTSAQMDDSSTLWNYGLGTAAKEQVQAMGQQVGAAASAVAGAGRSTLSWVKWLALGAAGVAVIYFVVRMEGRLKA